MTYRITITYCTQCRWLLRAAWMAQELLTTFNTDLEEVALRPGSGGIYEVHLNNELILSRKQAGRFPEAKELKQLVRDRIDPERDLGHSDRRAIAFNFFERHSGIFQSGTAKNIRNLPLRSRRFRIICSAMLRRFPE